MRWREPPIGVVLSELLRVPAEAADRAHVLPLHRDRVARLEAVPDANPKARLGPRGRLARLPRPQLHPRSRWNRHQVADLDRVLDRLFLGLAAIAGGLRDVRDGPHRTVRSRVAGPAEGVDLAGAALEVDRALDLADIDDLGLRNEQVGLARLGDPDVGLSRK